MKWFLLGLDFMRFGNDGSTFFSFGWWLECVCASFSDRYGGGEYNIELLNVMMGSSRFKK